MSNSTDHGVIVSPSQSGDAIADVLVDLDNPETARKLESSARGLSLVRVIVKRGGKHCYAWLDVGNFYGRPELSLVLDTKQGQKRTDKRIVPYREG